MGQSLPSDDRAPHVAVQDLTPDIVNFENTIGSGLSGSGDFPWPDEPVSIVMDHVVGHFHDPYLGFPSNIDNMLLEFAHVWEAAYIDTASRTVIEHLFKP